MRFGILIKKTNIIFISSILLLNSLLYADSDLFGYFVNRFFLINDPEISWNNIDEKFDISDYMRLRLKYKACPSKKLTLNLAVDVYSFHGTMKSPVGAYDGAENSGNNNVKIDLDRAYIDIYFKDFDISIGKQRVAMGISYLWAPLDIFNRINIFEPKEEKPGTNAFKIYLPIGSSSSFTGVCATENDFSSSKFGFRAQTQILSIDTGITFIRSELTETSIYGLDLRGENFIGWWIEAGYFVSPHSNDVKVVLGFDYTFAIKNGLYWLNEFFFDSSGEKDSSNYDYNQILSGNRFTLGQKYLLSMLRYSFSNFLSPSLSYISNFSDGSYIINPSIHYEISQNILLTSGFYFPLGKKGEFKKNKQNLFFIWLKINF